METEIVYLGRSRTNDLLLRAEDANGDMQAVDLSTATKITISFGDVLVSSTNADNGSITWDKSGYAVGEVRLALGAVTMPQGYYEAPLIVYDPTHTDGLPWGNVPAQVWSDQEAAISGLPNYLWTPTGDDGAAVPYDGSENVFFNTYRAAGQQDLLYRVRDALTVLSLEGTNTDTDAMLVLTGLPRTTFGAGGGVWDFLVKWYQKDGILTLGWWHGPNTQELVMNAYVDGRYDNQYVYGDVVPPGNDYTQAQYGDQSSPSFSEGWLKLRYRLDFDTPAHYLRVWDPAGAEPTSWQDWVNPLNGSCLMHSALPIPWMLVNCEDSAGLIQIAEFGWERQ